MFKALQTVTYCRFWNQLLLLRQKNIAGGTLTGIGSNEKKDHVPSLSSSLPVSYLRGRVQLGGAVRQKWAYRVPALASQSRVWIHRLEAGIQELKNCYNPPFGCSVLICALLRIFDLPPTMQTALCFYLPTYSYPSSKQQYSHHQLPKMKTLKVTMVVISISGLG